MLSLIGNAFKLVLFFLGLWKEKNALKAKQKAKLAKEVVDAFEAVKPKTRVSRLNAVIGRINQL